MAEDLQGFWDMVYFQVDNIYKKFSSFAEMESNSWKTVAAPAAADDGDSIKPRRSKVCQFKREERVGCSLSIERVL